MFFYSLTAQSPINPKQNRARNFIETMKRLMLLLSKMSEDKTFSIVRRETVIAIKSILITNNLNPYLSEAFILRWAGIQFQPVLSIFCIYF